MKNKFVIALLSINALVLSCCSNTSFNIHEGKYLLNNPSMDELKIIHYSKKDGQYEQEYSGYRITEIQMVITDLNIIDQNRVLKENEMISSPSNRIYNVDFAMRLNDFKLVHYPLLFINGYQKDNHGGANCEILNFDFFFQNAITKAYIGDYNDSTGLISFEFSSDKDETQNESYSLIFPSTVTLKIS